MNEWPAELPESLLKDYFVRRDQLSIDQEYILWGMRIVVPPRVRKKLGQELHH